MNREQAQAQLELWMNGDLGEAEGAVLRQQLEAFPDLLAEMQLWEEMGAIQVEEPRPVLGKRLSDMLDAFRAEAGVRRQASGKGWMAWLEQVWPSQPLAAMAVATICLAVGLAGGWMANSARLGGNDDALRALRKELSDTREIAILAMLERPGAADRLRGVSDAASLRGTPALVRSALLRTLRFDSSVNVRLAALDALRGQSQEPEVRLALQQAVQEEESPLVQLELVRALAVVDHPEARQTLADLAADSKADASVRNAAARGLQLEF